MDWLARIGLGRAAADIVALIHAGWILFLLGGVLVARRGWVREIHLAGLLTNVGLDLAGLDCPLTTLERALRLRFDPGGWYAGPFLQHYLGTRLGLALPPAVVQWLGVGLLVGTWSLYRFRHRAAVKEGREGSRRGFLDGFPGPLLGGGS